MEASGQADCYWEFIQGYPMRKVEVANTTMDQDGIYIYIYSLLDVKYAGTGYLTESFHI